MTFTKKQLIAAFDEWQRRYNSNAADFDAEAITEDKKTYGERCADYVAKLVAA